MKIEEKFNKRTAGLVEVQPPSVFTGSVNSALGIRLMFFRVPGSDDQSTLSMHMTPAEALQFAETLVSAARRMI